MYLSSAELRDVQLTGRGFVNPKFKTNCGNLMLI